MRFSRNSTGRVSATIGLGLLALGLIAPPARAQAVQIQNEELSFASNGYTPAAVNDSQSVVGNYTNLSGVTLGFLNAANSPTESLEYPGSDKFTRANGITSNGTIVGDFFGDDGVYHGYIMTAGYFGPPWNLKGYDEKKNKFSTSLLGVSSDGVYVSGAANPKSNVEGFVVNTSTNTTYQFSVNGKDDTYVLGVNETGTAVGEYNDGSWHGFMWSPGGNPIPINYTGEGANPKSTACTGINDYGVITCSYIDQSNLSHGFIYTPSSSGPPTETLTDLTVISVSDAGYMVGIYTPPGGGANVGFLQYPQHAQPLPDTVTPKNVQTESISVYAIDRSGNMAGMYTDDTDVSHGMWMNTQNKLTSLDAPGAAPQTTICQAINGPTEIVCNYADSAGNSYASTYNAQEDSWTEVTFNGGSQINVYGINSLGHMAGVYSDALGTHGFLLIGDEVTTLNATTDATFTVATGVNVHDEVAAFWGDAAGDVESSVYYLSNNDWTTVNLPGATNVYVGGIDDQLDLTYTWVDSGGNDHGGFRTLGTNPVAEQYYLFDVPPGGTQTRSYAIVLTTGATSPTMVGRDLPTAGSSNFSSYQFTVAAY
jgi:hypothetical protein